MEFISLFDVIGPNMIGPSSSHTAGAANIALMARRLFQYPLERVEFTLYGSFAQTYRGHGTDKALLGGVLGAFITFTVIKSVGKLGPAKAIAAIVISQVLAAYLIELFGLFGCEQVRFEWKKLIGVVLMIGGLLVFKLAGGDNG